MADNTDTRLSDKVMVSCHKCDNAWERKLCILQRGWHVPENKLLRGKLNKQNLCYENNKLSQLKDNNFDR